MSIADRLRAEQAEKLAALSPARRIELAFELGRRDLALYAAAHSLSTTEARKRLRAQRQLGRARSVCSEQ